MIKLFREFGLGYNEDSGKAAIFGRGETMKKKTKAEQMNVKQLAEFCHGLKVSKIEFDSDFKEDYFRPTGYFQCRLCFEKIVFYWQDRRIMLMGCGGLCCFNDILKTEKTSLEHTHIIMIVCADKKQYWITIHERRDEK